MQIQPGTLQCPNCGGEARPDSVRCDWCGSSLATVACPSCFGTLFVGMRHCPFCGEKAARQTRPDDKPIQCPRCNVAMHPVEVGKSTLIECPQCGGLWVDTASFQSICSEREAQEEVLGIPSSLAVKSKSPVGRMYVPCPECGELMNRLNFAGCSGVIIDWCKQHGSWFDHSELQQIVAFIREGGLKRSRAREKEKLQEETRRLREAQRELSAEQQHQSQLSANWGTDDSSFLNFLSGVWGILTKEP